ncbi:MAG: hypothetical protein MK052_01045 [Alphaproteobacteria bacterium]|nr:hypothetical protein [Alphaproteobacteria bacterium]
MSDTPSEKSNSSEMRIQVGEDQTYVLTTEIATQLPGARNAHIPLVTLHAEGVDALQGSYKTALRIAEPFDEPELSEEQQSKIQKPEICGIEFTSQTPQNPTSLEDETALVIENTPKEVRDAIANIFEKNAEDYQIADGLMQKVRTGEMPLQAFDSDLSDGLVATLTVNNQHYGLARGFRDVADDVNPELIEGLEAIDIRNTIIVRDVSGEDLYQCSGIVCDVNGKEVIQAELVPPHDSPKLVTDMTVQEIVDDVALEEAYEISKLNPMLRDAIATTYEEYMAQDGVEVVPQVLQRFRDGESDLAAKPKELAKIKQEAEKKAQEADPNYWQDLMNAELTKPNRDGQVVEGYLKKLRETRGDDPRERGI